MRFMSLFLSIFLLSTFVLAQQSYLVSPRDEVIPLKRGMTPGTIIAKHQAQARLTAGAGACGDRFIFGYPEDIYNANSNFGAYHKDVMGEWFVAKATGTVDTVYWEALGSVGALDSTLYMRIHRSRIGPTYGPGVAPHKAPCQNWGYFANTNDLDQGTAAFPDDATDTNWISTIAPTSGPPTLAPFTKGLWGFGGVPVIDHSNSINEVAMLDIGVPLPITTGQQFFISQRVKGPNAHIVDDRTEFAASGFHVTTSDENYPSRDWKFYEHDSGPSNCAGIPRTQVKRGWVARGGFTNDSLDVALFNYWYSMHVTSNVPPRVDRIDVISNTFDTGVQPITCDISDCNPADPPKAGVKSAELIYFVNNVPQPTITMHNVGGDEWDATLPGQAVGKTVTYKVLAKDSSNLTAFSATISYTIVTLYSPYYVVDTGYSGPVHDIRLTGTPIDFDQFYLPPGQTTNNAKDDGSFGPIDMGKDFCHFGGKYRYAWVSLDGAIALSNDPNDTVDVNADGFFTGGWHFPTSIVRKGGRSDSDNVTAMPAHFIAPFWTDTWVGDTTFKCDGHVAYGNDGDTCLFIVEWDSLGSFSSLNPACDEMTFRVVLNRCDGSIEFQYDDAGTLGNDSLALVGMGGDSTYEYIAINDGHPDITRPRSGHMLKFVSAAAARTRDAWNMLSVGVTPMGGDYHKVALYPTAKSDAFYYEGQYKAVGTGTMTNGPGYWLKFSGAQGVGPYGTLIMSQYDAVKSGWNMVGAVGCPCQKTSIVQSTPGMITSNYFGYGTSGYFTTSTLRPGYSYWAKSNTVGTLFLNGYAPSSQDKSVPATNLNAFNRLTIMDGAGHQQVLYIGAEGLMKESKTSYEMPPAMMEFDARFASQNMVETYPAQLEKGARLEYPLAISGGSPVKIVYEMNRVTDRQFVLTADGKTVATLNGAGVVTLDANVKNVALTVSEGAQIPKVYALSQNYPNPFNPTTRLNFDMPKTAVVDITVYDLLGRKIATLYSGEKSEGRHTIEWNGADAHGLSVPTGVYFIRMTADDFNATRKVMLMK